MGYFDAIPLWNKNWVPLFWVHTTAISMLLYNRLHGLLYSVWLEEKSGNKRLRFMVAVILFMLFLGLFNVIFYFPIMYCQPSFCDGFYFFPGVLSKSMSLEHFSACGWLSSTDISRTVRTAARELGLLIANWSQIGLTQLQEIERIIARYSNLIYTLDTCTKFFYTNI